jgi:hypothetical protein
MALLSSYSTGARTVMAAAIAASHAGGKLAFYTSPQRANADAAIGASTKVAEYTLTTLVEASGVLTAGAIAAVANVAAGTATWAVLTKADGSCPIDLTVGRNGYAADGVTVSGGAVYNINLNSPVFAANAESQVTAFTITVPATGT